MRIVRSLLAVAVVVIPAVAQADGGSVDVVKSQFTDKVEQSNPVASQDQLSQAATVTYWVAVKNDIAPTTITLVWKLDGHEAARQSLDVGTAPAWKTWGSHPRQNAKSIEVDVLDASGTQVKSDTVSF